MSGRDWNEFKKRQTVMLFMYIIVIAFSIVVQFATSNKGDAGNFSGDKLLIFFYWIILLGSFLMTLLWGVIQIDKSTSVAVKNVGISQLVFSVASILVLIAYAAGSTKDDSTIKSIFKCTAFLMSGATLYDSVVNILEINGL
jgi:glucan phosphoethanolaminetransferase (alkaline phosphatase superfamily)